MMPKVMITVCGEFGDRHWVSDLLLTNLVKLSQKLQKIGVEVKYADSMDNAQMNSIKGCECEVEMAMDKYGLQGGGVDALFVLFRDDERNKNLFERFRFIRETLPREIKLVLVEVYINTSLTTAERDNLASMNNCFFVPDHDFKGLEEIFRPQNVIETR